LFQVVRFPGKNFRQRRRVGGEWIWQTSGVRRSLYRLPQLMAADKSKVVHIVEGEKDVASLERLELLATTNPSGAGKWKFVADEARRVLVGRVVVIISDADETGRKHAAEVAESLRGAAKSVRVVEAPAPHKDVSDFVAAGGDVAAWLASSEPAPRSL